MKNKMMKRVKDLLFILGTSITIVTFLSGCAKKDTGTKTYSKENEVVGQNNVNNVENSQKQNNTNKENTENMLLKDSSKPVVYSCVEANEIKDNKQPNGENYSASYQYRIPQININSAAAEAINKLISDDYVKIYNDYKAYEYSGCGSIDYSYAINGDVLSVEVSAQWDGGMIQRSAYNINTKNGNEVTHSDLLKQRGILETDFPGKLSALMTELLKTMYTPSSELTEPDTIEFFNTQYRRTTDIRNCSTGNDMYLNSNNELCVILERFNLAGPDSTEIIVNFDKKIIENDGE